MAIALGHEMKARTGMVIALGIGIHNIPEGMAIAAPLIMGGMRRLHFRPDHGHWYYYPFGNYYWAGGSLHTALPPSSNAGLSFGYNALSGLLQLWPQAGFQHRRTRWYGFFIGVLIIFIATYV